MESPDVRIAIVFGAIVLTLFVLIWSLQRKLMYFPSSAVPDPHALGLANVQEIAFPTADGLTLSGWFINASTRTGMTMLVFNGNAGNRAHRAALADVFAGLGMAVLLFDYRGYGGNPGSPTEAGLKADARAARNYLLTRPDVNPKQLGYFGESLGTAVAAELAEEYPPAVLILRSPFTSTTALGQHHYPWLPVRWMLRDRFETLDRIRRIRAPILVIAGDRDRIVPIEESRRVFEVASEPKSLVVVRGADHNDEALFTGKTMIDGMVRFLADIR
jgi:fermentation-respiration switch protein FrsA (DUF1100 family)